MWHISKMLQASCDMHIYGQSSVVADAGTACATGIDLADESFLLQCIHVKRGFCVGHDAGVVAAAGVMGALNVGRSVANLFGALARRWAPPNSPAETPGSTPLPDPMAADPTSSASAAAAAGAAAEAGSSAAAALEVQGAPSPAGDLGTAAAAGPGAAGVDSSAAAGAAEGVPDPADAQGTSNAAGNGAASGPATDAQSEDTGEMPGTPRSADGSSDQRTSGW